MYLATRSSYQVIWESGKHVSQLGNSQIIILILCYRYAYGKFSNTHEATIGGCFLTKDEELDNHIVKYEIWDTAG